jgi:oligopeptidase A
MQLPSFQTLNPAEIPGKLQQLLEKQRHELMTMITTQQTGLDILHLFNVQGHALELFWSPCSHLNSVIGSEAWRECYTACLPMLSAHDTFIHQNEDLYRILKNMDTQDLSPGLKKMQEDFLISCELSGIGLSEAKRKRVEEISERLDHLAQQFQNQIIDSQKQFRLHLHDEKKLAGVPDHVIENAKHRASEEGDQGFVLGLDQPTYSAVISYAEDRDLRKMYFKAYNTRASEICAYDKAAFDNTPLILETLKLREALAQLVGMPNYAAYSLKTKMAKEVSRVQKFLNELTESVLPIAAEDVETIKKYAKSKGFNEELEPWDTSYYVQKRQEEIFSINQEALRAYFPLRHVLKGVNALLNKLYDLVLEPYSVTDIWHPDAECLALKQNNEILGIIYCDWFSREGKRGGAWMDTFQTRCRMADGTTYPAITFLTCNFAKPAPGKDAGLTHDELLTLLHELGHCLHHLLSEVDEFSVSGVHGVEWDAVELPSQWMENWGWQKQWVNVLSQHLPEALFDQLLAAKNDMVGIFLLRQLLFATYDFSIHEEVAPQSLAIVQNQYLEILRKFAVWPVDWEQRFPQTFSHIFAGGYAAGYYSYLWADVLSCDVFEWFEQNMENMQACGDAFRKKVLSRGGACSALDAFKDLMGREPEQKALLRAYGLLKE